MLLCSCKLGWHIITKMLEYPLKILSTKDIRGEFVVAFAGSDCNCLSLRGEEMIASNKCIFHLYLFTLLFKSHCKQKLLFLILVYAPVFKKGDIGPMKSLFLM